MLAHQNRSRPRFQTKAPLVAAFLHQETQEEIPEPLSDPMWCPLDDFKPILPYPRQMGKRIKEAWVPSTPIDVPIARFARGSPSPALSQTTSKPVDTLIRSFLVTTQVLNEGAGS